MHILPAHRYALLYDSQLPLSDLCESSVYLLRERCLHYTLLTLTQIKRLAPQLSLMYCANRQEKARRWSGTEKQRKNDNKE